MNLIHVLFFGPVWAAAPFYASLTLALTGQADWLIFDRDGGVYGQSFGYWLVGAFGAIAWFVVVGVLASATLPGDNLNKEKE